MPKQPASRARQARGQAEPSADQAAPASAAVAAASVAVAPDYDPRSEMAAIRYDLTQLQLCVKQVIEINAIENVMCRGFAEMREGLDLLRQSNSGRTGLEQDVGRRLTNLRTQLERPSWSGATTLPVHDAPVKFIGEAAIAPTGSRSQPPFYREASPREAGRDYPSNRDQYGSEQS